MKVNYIRQGVVRLLVSFLVVSSCSALYGEPAEDSVHVLVSRFGDNDQMGIPVAEIVQGWLEDVFGSYDYITVDLLDQSFSFDENELNEAVSAAHAIGGDIVFVGAYLDAVEDLLAAVELDPDNARYNAQLGAQLKQAEKFSEVLFYSHITIVSV
ncbi:MAG: hypothetical protein KAT09_07415 [Candidatus Aegiribacteria sp.]|nr:hypothetical protein [Candidatus Aegiribacteria sp.]